MSTPDILQVQVSVSSQETTRSESPLKPDFDAMEPCEGAKCVPSPASSAYDADQSDTWSERKGGEDRTLVTEQMIEEENKLKELAEKEEQRLKEERDQEWAQLAEQDKAERFQRLQQLLQKSNMYTVYLIERMKRQQAEEDKRKERRAKKLARLQEAKRQEEEKKNEEENIGAVLDRQASNGNSDSVGKVAEEIDPGHNLRRKRTSVQVDAEVEKQAPAPKKRRSAKGDKQDKGREKKADDYGMDGGSTVTEAAKGVTTLSEAAPCSEGVKPSMQESPEMDNMCTENDEVPMCNGEPIPDDQPLMMTGGVLRSYQLEGYLWLRTLYENGMNGILADEMGLGKTVQCIAMMAHMVYMGVPGPFLIVGPLSTVPNWYNEFQRFAPQLPVLLYHGSKEERKELRGKIDKAVLVRPEVKVKTIVITSYEVAMKDQRLLQKHNWRYLVVDEGHRIKNTHCRLIGALRLYHTANRLLLTGTPLQNNLAELWSLLNFLLPEIFDDLGSFEAWFDIEHMGDEMAVDKQKKDVLLMLHQILTPFMLRRLKTDVDLNIPPKKEIMVYAPLKPLQKEFYAALLDKTIFAKIEEKNGTVKAEKVDSKGRPVRKVTEIKVDYSLMLGGEKDVGEKESGKRRIKDDDEIDNWAKAIIDMHHKRQMKAAPEQKMSQLTIKLRNVMMQLRKCCSHPFLLEHPLDPKTGELTLDERIISQSGKMMVLDRMLKELHRRKHKVLIFSQMTKMLDLLEDYCVLRKYNYCRLDGAMDIDDRRASMAQYQKADSDKFVFLLSTRAGGLGINLTAADTVIIYDSDWNPQCDLQAQDRCHRIGQTRPVMVYRLVTANTIDQRIVERASAKRKLEKLIIYQGKFKSGIRNFKTSQEPIGSEELLELLNSKDHESEAGDQQEVISDADLKALLDRSDLETKWTAKLNKPASGDTSDSTLDSEVTISLSSCHPSSSAPATPTPTTKTSRRQSGRGRSASKKSSNDITTTSAAAAASKAPMFKVIDVDYGDCMKS